MGFEIGERVGDYEILGVLGAGGMGQVYRVRNVISNRVEAMKVLLPDSAAEPARGERFLSEIRMLAAFDHPNIAQLYTAFQAENQLLMVMEFVEGETLEERGERTDIPLEEGLGYIEQVLDALGYAHGRGVVHRDVKPANIMITPSGIAKLLDFGIAKLDCGREVTQPGTTVGSVLYMSPEQVRGQPVDARSDLYSMGVVLYQLATGRRPFEADNLYRLMEMQMNEAPVPPSAIRDTTPEPLSQLILMTLAKEPEARFQKAEALWKAVASVRQTLGSGKNPATAVTAAITQAQMREQTRQPMAHRGLWITAGALAVVTILAAGALLLPYWDRTHAQAKFGTVKDTGSAATAAGSQPQPVKDGNLAVSTTTPSRQTDAQAPVAKRPAPAAKVVNREVTIYDVVAAQSEGRVNPTGQATRPANEPTASVAPTPAVADSGTNAGTNTDALEKFQDRMIQLGARAAAVKDTIERLRSEQAASGLGLRQDIAATLNRMSAYMDEAERALNGGDLKLSQKRADQAEKEITSLEEFTGR